MKREHAIETGVIERLYDLKKGVTETFINDGFIKSFLSHGDTNISDDDLMSHLNDHLDSVNFVFDIVKENRPLSIGFIKELHQLMTRNQKYVEGRDQFGNKSQTELLKGQYKQTENNPTREDGTKILYCSPDHVASEMDALIRISNENARIPPLILATWFHHAFTTIHPFQDGNGRMARLLTSLIFIKHGLFPFTVLRAEAKVSGAKPTIFKELVGFAQRNPPYNIYI
ncbi:MAG: Fic family protein [Pseudomonadota bacterium]